MSTGGDGLCGLVPSWREAAARPEVAAALDALAELVRAETLAQAPRCEASGRCCNFARFGHRLYVTGLEAALTLSRLSAISAAAAGNERRIALAQLPTTTRVEAARLAGDCPFLDGTTCGVHTIKPLACRVFFCDESTEAWQHDLTERLLGEVRRLHEAHRIEYRYAEWRDLLDAFARHDSQSGSSSMASP